MASEPPPSNAGPAARGGEGAPSDSTRAGATAGDDPFEERPELFVGGAFVGGFALAMLLRRLAP